MEIALRTVGPYLHEVEPRGAMRVPARVIGDEELVESLRYDRGLEQLADVAALPGIARAALGLPDLQEGDGFPTGAVAATALPDGAISPGAVGSDIHCGVRLLASRLRYEDVSSSLPSLLDEIGRAGPLTVARVELERLLAEGCPSLFRRHGIGHPEDLEYMESGGALPQADPAQVSERAKARGQGQLGTLGGGDHFVELGMVHSIFDAEAARRLGLFLGQVTVLVHAGSRDLGRQVCADHARAMDVAARRYGIAIAGRPLSCAPFSSPEGRSYLGAMWAAGNFASCNRHVVAHRVREAFRRVLSGWPGAELRLVYDLAHNTAAVERHGGRELCVHRRGATRALGPSSAELPKAYRGLGQPVLIPGCMATASHVLVATDDAAELSLGSVCHGAGRRMTRSCARREVAGWAARAELDARGVMIRSPSGCDLGEEAPLAYHDVDRVVDAVHGARLARKVARLVPVGVVKG